MQKYKTSEYRIWARMKYRCSNKNSSDYKYYGARGKYFEAQISKNNKKIYLGYFKNPEDASKAYQDAKKELELLCQE